MFTIMSQHGNDLQDIERMFENHRNSDIPEHKSDNFLDPLTQGGNKIGGG